MRALEFGIDFGDSVEGGFETKREAVDYLRETRKWYRESGSDLSLLKPGTIKRREIFTEVTDWHEA